MATLYFFTHDETQHGPYSADEMLGLATAGKIVPTDSVWRQGVGLAIPAARVKNLFQAMTAAPLDALTGPAMPTVEAPDDATCAAAVADSSVVVPAAEQPRTRVPEHERPRRVVSIKGGTVVSQDGRQVQFRKKCPTCGTEDQCRTTTVIRPGSMKVPYYCRKCRKGRTVEMMGAS